MDDPVTVALAAVARDLADLARAAADRLDSIAADLTPPPEPQPEPEPDPPPPIPPPPAPHPSPVTLLEPRLGLSFGVGDAHPPDRDKLAELFGVGHHYGVKLGYWADPSRSLSVRPDGSMVVVLDKARRTASPNSGGSSWVNAAVPLLRPVEAAKLTMRVRFGVGAIPWQWGTSGKLPGLMTWNEGRAPGGGHVTPRNHSTRICWNDWNRDGASVRLGPYVYGQHIDPVPNQIWATDAKMPGAVGTIRWGGPVATGLDEPDRDEGHLMELSIFPDGDPGWGRVVLNVDGAALWDMPMRLLGPDIRFGLSHVTFAVMYGGDGPDYGPDAEVTALEISEFRVTQL